MTAAPGSPEQMVTHAGHTGWRRTPRIASALASISAVVIALAACGSTSATQPAQTSAQPPSSSSPAAAQAAAQVTHSSPSQIDAIVNNAKATYHRETEGPKVFRSSGASRETRVLLNALSRGDLAGAQAEADAQLNSPINHLAHVTRISVIRGSRVLVNATVNSDGVYVVAPQARILRSNGRTLGTLLVSLQDVTGYVKLVHRITGAESWSAARVATCGRRCQLRSAPTSLDRGTSRSAAARTSCDRSARPAGATNRSRSGYSRQPESRSRPARPEQVPGSRIPRSADPGLHPRKA